MWLGGGSDASLKRAARVGDGFTFAGAGRSVAEQAEKLRGYLAEAGRDPAAFPLEFAIAYGVGPERWQRSVELAEQGGVSHFSVNTMSSTAAWAKTPPSGFTTPAEHIGGLEQFIKAVRG